jgi:hypothetical protein
MGDVQRPGVDVACKHVLRLKADPLKLDTRFNHSERSAFSSCDSCCILIHLSYRHGVSSGPPILLFSSFCIILYLSKDSSRFSSFFSK